MNIKRALLMSGACGILATAVSTALAQQTSEVAEVVINISYTAPPGVKVVFNIDD